MSSQHPHNSILNLLNPYASVTRSVTSNDPDSPSTLLLRELTGVDDEEGAHAQSFPDPTELDGQSSPTTPTRRRASQVISNSSSSEDEEAPPRSLLYGGDLEPAPRRSGERTPRSPHTSLPPPEQSVALQSRAGRATSPGPFRAPSSSASERQSVSDGRSRSTSPGPSTISIYASGYEGTALNTSSTHSSRDPSTSPRQPAASSSRVVPTFREHPRPGPPPGTTSSSSHKRSSPRLTNGASYLDPAVPPPKDRKGKDKVKNQGAKKYLAVPTQEEEEEEEEDHPAKGMGRYAGFARRARGGKNGLDDYEKALWDWVNVDDLDGFLQEVYAYYKGKGIYCIALARVLNLLTTFFVISFSTFLMSCIDYSKLTSSVSGPNSVGRLEDVLIGQCLTSTSFPHLLFTIIVAVFYVFQLATFAMSFPRLVRMYRFYTYLLRIPDADIQTLPWPEIVRLIGEIRKHNPVTSLSNDQTGALAELAGDGARNDSKKLDAHDVANRILRQENYLIALFNKDLLDLRVRLPVPHSMVHLVPASLLAPPFTASLPSNAATRERRFISFGKNTLTKALEWNLRFCLMGYLFDRSGQVRKEFVRERGKKDLVEGLKRRFIFMGILNAMFAPFIVIYLLSYSFFRYFEEYHKNPSSIGSRQYTPYAQWKFREFNELPHLFERRLDRSYPTAKEYIDQFPKERTALVMRFVAFVAGSFAAVLLVASLIDPDLFLHFEITPHRTVLFYLGLFGSVLAIARGMVPEENLVFDPEASLREVVRWTHYLPGEWRGKLHSQMVHAEFGTLFAMKIAIFFTELLSVLLTPFILFFSLPPCAGAIIDFFREFTVHVDGVGYVCSFAVFDFRRHGNLAPGENLLSHGALQPDGQFSSGKDSGKSAAKPNSNAEWRSNENKMEKSFLHFKATHPDWQPSDPASSVFLDRLVGMHQAQSHPSTRQTVHRGHNEREQGGLSTSVSQYGRGLGLDEKRSRSYGRAWASPRGRLETMGEGEAEESEGEDGDWNRGYHEGFGHEEGRKERRDEGFLRDEGMVGLLQQVMRR